MKWALINAGRGLSLIIAIQLIAIAPTGKTQHNEIRNFLACTFGLLAVMRKP